MNNVLVSMVNVSITSSVNRTGTLDGRPLSNQEESDVVSSLLGEKGLFQSQIISTINKSSEEASVSPILHSCELEESPVIVIDDAQLLVQRDFEREQQDALVFAIAEPNEVEDENLLINISTARNQFENPELWLLSQRKDWKFPSCSSILKFLWIFLFALGIVTCWVYLCLSWYDILAKKLGTCQGRTNGTGLLVLLMFSTSSATCGLFYLFCLILYIKNSHSVDSVAWGTSCFLVAIGSEMVSLIVFSIMFVQDRVPHCYESVVYFVPSLIIQALILFYLGLPYLVNQHRIQRYKILALKRKVAPLIS